MGDAPIAHRGGRTVAAQPRRLVEGSGSEAWVAARGDRVVGLIDLADMWPNDAVRAEVERLFREHLALLATVRGDADDRRHRRRHRAGVRDLPTDEQVLQAVAKSPYVPRVVLALEDDAVVLGRAEGDRRLDVGVGERAEGGEPLLERPDDAVQPRNVGHSVLLRASGDLRAERNGPATR